HRAVTLLFWLTHEHYAFGFVGAEIAPKVVGVQKQKHTPTGLVAYPRRLLLANRAGEQQMSSSRAWWRHNHPALVLLRNVGIFDKRKTKRANIEGNRLVVLAHHKRYQSD